MNERIKELAEQAGWMMGDEVEGFNTRLEKFAELIVEETRVKAIEEVRQQLKWADWPISSWAIVEDACEKLSQRKPDNRYPM
jgi:hypothetical protein